MFGAVASCMLGTVVNEQKYQRNKGLNVLARKTKLQVKGHCEVASKPAKLLVKSKGGAIALQAF